MAWSGPAMAGSAPLETVCDGGRGLWPSGADPLAARQGGPLQQGTCHIGALERHWQPSLRGRAAGLAPSAPLRKAVGS
jgi:hypothetical protein